MKLSKMIENLQEVLKEQGDIDCYYAVDDEGNEYKEVIYSPSVMFKDSYGDIFCEEDVNDDNEFDDEDRAELKKVCVVN